MNFKKQQSINKKPIKGILLGIIVSFTVMIILSMVMADMINKETIGMSSLTAGTTIILLISVFIGNIVSIAMTQEKQLIISGIHAAAILGSIVIGNMLLGDGISKGVGRGTITILAGAAISWGIRFIKPKNKYKSKRRYC